MKYILALIVALTVSCHAQIITTNWAIQWQVPTNIPVLSSYVAGTNQAYNLYGTTNFGQTITAWPLLAYWPSWSVVTNGSTIWYSNSITLPPGVWYTALTGTNQQGESFFSPVALTGPMATTPTSLTMLKGQ